MDGLCPSEKFFGKFFFDQERSLKADQVSLFLSISLSLLFSLSLPLSRTSDFVSRIKNSEEKKML